jgi:hypothetical protein
MKYRIAVWASVGLLVACGWAVYFFTAARQSVPTVALLTQPIALVVRHSPLTVGWVLFANTVTYALIGLIVETVRTHRRA